LLENEPDGGVGRRAPPWQRERVSQPSEMDIDEAVDCPVTQRLSCLASLLGRSMSSTSDFLPSIESYGCRSQGSRFSSGSALSALP
jgi:hypothetical protein